MRPCQTAHLATAIVVSCLAFSGFAQAATMDMTTTTLSEDRPFHAPNCGIAVPACDGLLTINTTTKVTTITAIESVFVQGFGTFTFPDFALAPDLSDTQSAFSAAASALGLPTGATAESLTLFALPERSRTEEKRLANSSDDAVIVGNTFQGDLTELVVLQGSLTVDVFLTSRLERPYQLQAILSGSNPSPGPTPVPLPATAPLLLIGLAGLTTMRRRSKHRRTVR